MQQNKTVFIKTPEFIDEEKKLKDDINFCSSIAEVFSALIDVDAQRQQIRELFSKSRIIRDDLIRTELDDENLEKLLSAKEKLGIVNNPKIQFWVSFTKCFPKLKLKKDKITDVELLEELQFLFPDFSEFISYIFDQINYENYNEEASLRLIVELLIMSNLSLQNLNKYIYPSIDITELHLLDFNRAKESKKMDFKQSLFSNFINTERDKKEFLNLLAQYDSLNGSFSDEINYNPEKDLTEQIFKWFNIDINVKSYFNFEEIYSLNKVKYENIAQQENISKDLATQFIYENQGYESLLYFDSEIEQLIYGLKEWTLSVGNNGVGGKKELAKKKITFGNSSIFYSDFKDLYDQLENENLFHSRLSKIKIIKINLAKDPKKHHSPNRDHKKSRKLREDFGFLGEWIVFKHLLSTIKDKENIKWVSEYSKLAGVNSDGKDGLGYDIQYIPNDAKYPRYVEVKLVGHENSFPISSNEIHKGEELKKQYEIFLVRNINEPDSISIEVIQGPFDYKARGSFTDNELFTVINDNFILKFDIQ